MLFLLLVALHNIRWGVRESERTRAHSSLPPAPFLSVSLSRANFNFYVVPRWGTLRYDFNVAYLFAF